MIQTEAYHAVALGLASFWTVLAVVCLGFRLRLKSGGQEYKVIASVFWIALSVSITFYWWRKDILYRGEDLHTPLAIALSMAGILAGMLNARLLKRIAFVDSIAIVALFTWVPVIWSDKMPRLLAYGSSVAYFVLLLVASAMLLLLALTIGGAVGYIYGEGMDSHRRGSRSQFGYESFLGRRFLMAKRSSQMISLITMISVFAVMTGGAGMIIVMSVMNGFSEDLRSKIIGTNASMIVYKYGEGFDDYVSVMEKIKAVPGVEGMTPFALNEVMISSESNLSGAVIKGIDPGSVGFVSKLPKYMVEGSVKALDGGLRSSPRKMGSSLSKPSKEPSGKSPLEQALALARGKGNSDGSPPSRGRPEGERGNPVENDIELPGIIIGQEMSLNLHAMLGDTINVVSPVGEMGPTGPVPKAKTFRVVGIFFSGMFEYDAKFTYISLKEAQSFFGMGKSVTGIECLVNDIDAVKPIAQAVTKQLGAYPYHVRDWVQMNSNIFSALRLEKIAMFIILTSAIFMASLLILVALIMVVLEKGKEIAILKSMGATDASIMRIFVTYGLTIGIAGSILGVLLGVGLCSALGYFGIGLDPQVYYITNLPVKINWYEVLFVGISVIIVSFLATIPPAKYAAGLKPVEGLRME